jgi:hypothetical protein
LLLFSLPPDGRPIPNWYGMTMASILNNVRVTTSHFERRTSAPAPEPVSLFVRNVHDLHVECEASGELQCRPFCSLLGVRPWFRILPSTLHVYGITLALTINREVVLVTAATLPVPHKGPPSLAPLAQRIHSFYLKQG